MKFMADFETTTDIEDCRVWACGICSIDDEMKFEIGNSIEWFIIHTQLHKGSTYYFHNLKFDGEFILHYLLSNGYTYVKNKRSMYEKSFSCLINEAGVFYALYISYDDNPKKNCIEIYDSFKILPYSEDKIAKAFNLPIQKLEIDYDEYRPIGHKISQQELDYIEHDVKIVTYGLKELFKQGLTKMTQGSNALYDYKRSIGTKTFDRYFPVPYYDADVRQSYRGGYTYCNPKFKGLNIGEGIVLDVNSLYPSVMVQCPLPYGEGVFFEGEYKHDRLHPLYIQMIRTQFDLKEGYLPTIQLKNNYRFTPTEYVSSSEGEEIVLCLTCVDLELFKEHYNVYYIEYLSGWKFKQTYKLFTNYIDKWYKVKQQATIDGNATLRTIAKIMMNALYGKFGTRSTTASKIPYLQDDVVKYKMGEVEEKPILYIPVATFITAWARNKTIRSAQKCYDRFVYSDTDSLHLLGTELPKEIEIDDLKLGAWAHEKTFTRARFLHSKTYIEEVDGKLEVTCCGMPKSCHEFVTWENFKVGSSFPNKLTPTHVKGGIVLKSIDFTIRE